MVKRFLTLYESEFITFYRNNHWLIWLSLLYLLLKLPSLFEPYWYGDEGVTMTVGMAIRRGLLLYRDIFDNKPPILYLLAATVDGRLFYLKLISLFFGFGGVWFFYQLSKHVFTTKLKEVILSCLLFVVLSTTPIFEANIVNGEIIFIVFSLAAWYFFMVKNNYFISGLFFALSFLTKVPAFFDLIPLAILVLARLYGTKSPIWKDNLVRLVTAFFVPILATLIYFLCKGGLDSYLQSVFLQMINYASSWRVETNNYFLRIIFDNQLLKLTGMVLLCAVLFFRWTKRKDVPTVQLFSLWLACSLFGAILSARPYPHYLLQTIAPLSICLPCLFITKSKNRYILLTVLFVYCFFYFGYRFERYPVFGYYNNFINLAIGGQNSRDNYYRFFDTNLPETYKIAEIISAYTTPKDRILLWSNDAQLHAMARRLPVFRYTTAYHYIEKKADDVKDIDNGQFRLKLIVVDKRIVPNKQLNQIIDQGYYLTEALGCCNIYVDRNIEIYTDEFK